MAFGNPLISNTPVDDIYRSQADLYGNSFGNPMNPANQNNGWNIDPSLLSPSYMAPYRPHYGGPNSYNKYGHPGFFNGISQLSPFSADTPWGNPIMHQQDAIDDVSNRPADATMWGFQRIVMPIAAFHYGAKFARAAGLGFGLGAKFGSGIGGGMASAFGAESTLGLRATAASVKAAYSTEGIMGAASAIRGIGIGGAMNLGSRAIMAGAFGAATYAAAPLIIGQGLITAGEKGIVNPYINTRGSAKDLRNNFAGITFEDSEGNAITGKGLGFEESTKMAQQITGSGIQDMTFSTEDYRKGADMISRTGLLDNANKGQIVERIKENMKQVKLIMDIANMPEIKDAVEQLAKLQMAGASTQGGLFSTASQTMGSLGRFASMAGTSVQRMMNTVGAQGQYLYQANGMTPYLGQLAAANSYSALASAQRMGLISTEQIARMGGIEGATQASLTGQINSSQTLYNKMAMYNGFLGGQAGGRAGFGANQNAIDVVQKFGSDMSKDPLGVYGGMMLYGRQMAGKQIEMRGSLAVEDQVLSRMPQWLKNKDGKVNAEQAVPFLMQMGMNEDQIQGFFAQRMAESDQNTYDQRKKAMNAYSSERIRQYISDTGTYGGIIGGGIYSARKFGRNITEGAKSVLVDPFTTGTGKVGDAIQRLTDWAWFGSSVVNKNEDIDSILEDKTDKTKQKVTSLFSKVKDPYYSQYRAYHTRDEYLQHDSLRKFSGVADDMNDLIKNNKKGADLAVNYMNDKDIASRRKSLEKLINSGYLKNGWTNNYNKDFKDPEIFRKLDESLQSRKREAYKDDSTKRVNQSSAFGKELEKVDNLQVLNKFDTLQDIGLAVGIATDSSITAGTADEALKTNESFKRFASYHGFKDGTKALEEAQKIAVRARKTGLDGFATVVSAMDPSKFKDKNEALKEAFSINGGAHKDAMPNAKDITTEEALGASSEVRQDAIEKMKLYTLNKEGRLDFTNMRQAVTQIDNAKAVRDFQTAVNKFSDAVDKDGKGSKKLGFWSVPSLDQLPRNDAEQKYLNKN